MAFWITLVRGLLAIGLGVVLIFQPDKTRPMLVNFMGMFWLVSGIISLRWGARGERAISHVILEGDGLHRSVGVLPADHENREALLDQEADETVLRLKVKNIELVDPRRNEQKWHRVGLRRHRRVMDELN